MASGRDTDITVLQEHCKEFALKAVLELNWGDLYDAVVMDIGCGVGNSSEMIADLFPNIRRIIAFDRWKFENLRPENKYPKIKYYVADLMDRSSLSEWAGKMTRIFSMNCFNFIDHKYPAFENVHHLLQSGGGAALCFYLSSPVFRCLDLIYEIPKWRKYTYTLSRFPYRDRDRTTCDNYWTALESIGFEVVDCMLKDRIYTLISEEKFTESVHRILTNLLQLSSDIIEELMKDFMKSWVQIHGRTSDGKLRVRNPQLYVLIKKK